MKKAILIILCIVLMLPLVAYGVETQINNLNTTLNSLDQLRVENKGSKKLLQDLASGLKELEDYIRVNGASNTKEVYKILERAEGHLERVPDSVSEKNGVISSIRNIKLNLELNQTNEIEETNKASAKLTDINNHWAREYIVNLVNKGGISGYPDGTYKPNKTISVAEFVKIAVASALDGKVETNTGHWASGAFSSARKHNVLLLNDFPEAEWDKEINRYEMAYVMVRVAENILKEEKVGTNKVANIIGDYEKVKTHEYKYYIEQAYMKGLLAGKNGGVFDGNSNGTRAEAATMVVRMLEEKAREEVDTSKPVKGEARVIDLKDTKRPLIPREGDTVVDRNGVKTVLKIGPAGVLGEGQAVDYYTGIVGPNGHVFREGNTGTTSMGTSGETYLIDKRTGEGHFRADWDRIRNYYIIEAQDTLGHSKPAGYVHANYFKYTGLEWVWLGPVNM